MAQPQDKNGLIEAAQEQYQALIQIIEETGTELLKTPFEVEDKPSKCATFQQGENVKDLLVHIYEWQRLQSAFVDNIRKGTPKDFIPEPYRKNYKEMDAANWEKHRNTPLETMISLLKDSHQEMIQLMESFTEEQLFGKKVFKVTYTTTMAAYFSSVTTTPYSQSLKKIKSHIRALKKKK